MAKIKFRDQAERLLATAEISINGSNAWDIQVHDERLYARVFAEGSIGFGEAYMDGWWDSDQLDETMTRILGSEYPVPDTTQPPNGQAGDDGALDEPSEQAPGVGRGRSAL